MRDELPLSTIGICCQKAEELDEPVSLHVGFVALGWIVSDTAIFV
jgi:hypothetical protein